MALARAKRLQPLFNGVLFDEIVDAVQVPDVPAGTRKAAYDTALANENWMTQAEKDWLYHYLEHCGNDWQIVHDGYVPASTGW